MSPRPGPGSQIQVGRAAPRVGQRPDELSPRADVELGEHLAQMPFDRTWTEKQLGADLGVGVSVPGQPGDLRLLRGELVGRLAVRLRTVSPVASSSRRARSANASASHPRRASRTPSAAGRGRPPCGSRGAATRRRPGAPGPAATDAARPSLSIASRYSRSASSPRLPVRATAPACPAPSRCRWHSWGQPPTRAARAVSPLRAAASISSGSPQLEEPSRQDALACPAAVRASRNGPGRCTAPRWCAGPASPLPSPRTSAVVATWISLAASPRGPASRRGPWRRRAAGRSQSPRDGRGLLDERGGRRRSRRCAGGRRPAGRERWGARESAPASRASWICRA